MPKITLPVDEKVPRAARAYAKRRGTTLSELVRRHLETMVREDERIEEARRGLLDLIDKSTADMGPNYKWNREELYADLRLPRR